MNINWSQFDKVNLNEIITLEEHLQRNRRKKKKLSNSLINKFSLETICKKDSNTGLCGKGSNWMYRGDIQYNLALTAPFGIILTYEQIPQALLSFEVSSGLFKIKQNKGIKPISVSKSKYLTDSKGLRFISSNIRLMYDISLDLAEKSGMYLALIQSAMNREDFQKTKNPIFAWKLVNTFDNEPFRLGFKEEKDGNWSKPLI